MGSLSHRLENQEAQEKSSKKKKAQEKQPPQHRDLIFRPDLPLPGITGAARANV